MDFQESFDFSSLNRIPIGSDFLKAKPGKAFGRA
jgi:hypothetical protein